MRSFRPYTWWVIPTLGVSAGLGLFLGYPLAWLAYAAFNIGGVWLYCDGRRSKRSESVIKALAITMVPVGVIGVL